ncbi:MULTISPECIES: hypothetical protein [Kamptonema]|uniref:hypothetical protein n=1 Tax=Kamptonema TaxID=1501433 RepID=UPI0001DACD69|nr:MULTISPECIES: hypothetical protein [Kamptonema]CBN55077.1 hypothetical protein OSCI_1480013 [Kamptonema sp. PCC 6506]
MFKNLENIDWDRLESELGEKLVTLLKDLSADDKKVRSEAQMELWYASWHQGTLTWPAYFIVPFFQERLSRESEPDLLESILIDLAHLATAATFFGTQPVFKYEILELDKEYPSEYQEQLLIELGWVNGTFEAVYKGINLYLNLLEHNYPKVRIAAAYTLSCCKSEAERICNLMIQHFTCESDEMVKATIPLCLAFLSKSTLVDAAFCEEILNSNESDIVKLSAGVSLAYIAGENISNNAFNRLLSLIKNKELFTHLWEHYDNPMATAHYWMIINFFSRLDDSKLAQILVVLAEPEQQIYDCGDLLQELAFNWQKIPEGTTIDQLTEPQQVILRLIADRITTNQERLNTYNLLSFMGIKEVGLGPQEKLINFLNGEPLKYDA